MYQAHICFRAPGDSLLNCHFQSQMIRFLPIRVVISLLDSYHDLTGLPWWIIISSSTIMMRLAIFPLIVLQLKKLKRIAELLSKLPPPFPPPLSGRSFRDQLSLFWKEKKDVRCPSLLWFFSSFAIQAPCFFLCLVSVRRMSLDNHPGFDSGGILWFVNLTENPHGALGPILPLCVAGLHFVNVKISLQQSAIQNYPGSLGSLAKMYSIYLQALTLPIFIAGLNVPQGSLVYWVTNSSFSLIQLLCLHHPYIRESLGLLPRENAPPVLIPSTEERGNKVVGDILIRTKKGEVSAQSLSPVELTSLAVRMLTDGYREVAIKTLRIALKKDPVNLRALLLMGQTLLQEGEFTEALESLETAVSKLLENGYPTAGEELDLLILSSQWAGITKVKQGKLTEGIAHLERIAHLQEPEDLKSKAHYYDGIRVLASALLSANRKSESRKYLEMLIAYNPAYRVHLEELESEPKDLASEMISSRRDI